LDGAISARLAGLGLVLSGTGLLWIAPVAGSCWGKATRLRPRARTSARFVLFANRMAMVCGALLLWAGVRTLVDNDFAAAGVRDAARHAFGVGVITPLIVGMAQLIAPFFALRRVESLGGSLVDHGIFWLLITAAVLRVSVGLMLGHIDTAPRMHASAAAGVFAWIGLLLFASTMLKAIRGESRIKESLATAVQQKPSAK
jgi:hypothetical protein